MAVVRGIHRYPIKGLSAESLNEVRLEVGKPFPFDRVFALTRPGMARGVDPDAPRWAKKGMFLMLMLEDALARVHTQLDVETMQLRIFEGSMLDPAAAGFPAPLLTADLSQQSGRDQVAEFFAQLVPDLKGAPHLVHSPDGHFMDKPENVVSCINLNTVRFLEKEWGTSVHPLRFRANFYIDGVPPFEEFEWVGRDLVMGEVLFRVDRKNGRCGATNVNPITGARDLDIPGALRSSFGHKDVGIYFVAQSDGTVRVGDPIQVGERGADSSPPLAAPPFAQPGPGARICAGCYYVFEPGAPGAPAGTPFEQLPESWVCPDCGTVKETFRAYLGANSL